MYTILALLSGFLLAIMITANGQLSQSYNIYVATIILHVVAVVFSYGLCKIRKEKFDFKQKPAWIYLGGIVGVFITIANNLSFGQISMTSIIALGLFGQIIFSIFIDLFGLFKMTKRKLHSSLFVTITFALVGIFMMLDSTVTLAKLAVLYSFGAGILVVLNRTINARLAEKIGALPGAFVNHIVGLPLTVILALIVYTNNSSLFQFHPAMNIFMYLGGILGVTVVYLSNIIVYKLSAFKFTIFTFIAQIFTGIMIDMMLGLSVNDVSFIGGIIISIGIAINIMMEKINSDKEIEQLENQKKIHELEELHYKRVNALYSKKSEQ